MSTRLHACAVPFTIQAILLTSGLIALASPGIAARPPSPGPAVAKQIHHAESLLLQGRYQEVFPLLQDLLPRCKATGDRIGEANVENDLGFYYYGSGASEEALPHYRRAMAVAIAAGDRYDQAGILCNIGQVYQDTGDPRRALDLFQQSLRLSREVGDRATLARVTESLAALYSDLGEPQQAAAYFDQALKLAQAAHDRSTVASTLQLLGDSYSSTGDDATAETDLQRSLTLRRQLHDSGGEALTLNSLAQIAQRAGDRKKALALYKQAMVLAHENGSNGLFATTLNNLGILYSQDRQSAEALKLYQEALDLEHRIRYRTGEIAVLTNLGWEEMGLSRTTDAAHHLQQAISLVEKERTVLGGLPQARIGYLESNLGPYQCYLNLLTYLGEKEQAFALLQQMKARTLLDWITVGNAERWKGATAGERAHLAELHRQLGQASRRLQEMQSRAEPDVARLETLAQQVDEAERALQQDEDQLSARYPNPARDQTARTLVLSDMARVLPPDTALLEYAAFTLGGRDRLVTLCVTVQNGQPSLLMDRKMLDPGTIWQSVEDFEEECSEPGADYQADAHRLYDLLIAPVAAALAGKKHLVICPDGPLWDLPFQVLMPTPGKQFLIDRFDLSYASSATALDAAIQEASRSGRPHPTGDLLVFANPNFGGAVQPLPGTAAEARALKELFPDAVVYTGAQAQESTARRLMGRFRYLHFATHSDLNDLSPLMSSILMAKPPRGSDDDGLLTAREVTDLSLSADLVVLSACETASGENRGGEGIVGLAWAFSAAGAPSQVLSQWPVNDRSTAAFMQHFYAGLKAGADKSQALRQAAIALRAEPRYSHPAYWAPFLLLGPWKTAASEAPLPTSPSPVHQMKTANE